MPPVRSVGGGRLAISENVSPKPIAPPIGILVAHLPFWKWAPLLLAKSRECFTPWYSNPEPVNSQSPRIARDMGAVRLFFSTYGPVSPARIITRSQLYARPRRDMRHTADRPAPYIPTPRWGVRSHPLGRRGAYSACAHSSPPWL